VLLDDRARDRLAGATEGGSDDRGPQLAEQAASAASASAPASLCFSKHGEDDLSQFIKMGNIHCFENCCDDVCEIRAEVSRPPPRPPEPPARECTANDCLAFLRRFIQ